MSTITTAHLMRALLETPGLTTREYAALLGDTRNNVDGVIRRMERKALVRETMVPNKTGRGRTNVKAWYPTPALQQAFETTGRCTLGLRTEVMDLLADGHTRTSKEIAAIVGVPYETVRTCCRRLFAEKQIGSSVHAGRRYWKRDAGVRQEENPIKTNRALRQAVLAILEDQTPRTAADIAAALSKDLDSVRQCCRRLGKSGILRNQPVAGELLWSKADQTRGADGWTPGQWIHPIRARALGIPLRRSA